MSIRRRETHGVPSLNSNFNIDILYLYMCYILMLLISILARHRILVSILIISYHSNNIFYMPSIPYNLQATILPHANNYHLSHIAHLKKTMNVDHLEIVTVSNYSLSINTYEYFIYDFVYIINLNGYIFIIVTSL